MIIDWLSLLDWWWCALPVVGFVWAPKTWTPGELVSAAAMNTNIRDHLNEFLRTQTTTLTGTQNNFALEGPFVYLRCNNASALSITGALVDSGNLGGARLLIEAINANVTITDQDAGSTSDNRFRCDTSQDVVLTIGEQAMAVYDSSASRWSVGKRSAGIVEELTGEFNLLADPFFLIWPDGDVSDPAHWTSAGTGVSIARQTSGIKVGPMAAKLTYGSATAYLRQDILPSGDFDSYFASKPFSFGAWVYATSSDARIWVADGVGETKSAAHPGNSTWQWLNGTHILDASASMIRFTLGVAASGFATLCWPTVIRGATPPKKPLWPRVALGALAPTLGGDPITSGTGKWIGNLDRPFIVRDVQIEALSAVTGQAMILDINQWSGSVWNSMFSTKPQIAVSALRGGAQPDGTYAYRCFTGGFGTSVSRALINIDCDQAPTGGGKNPAVFIRFLSYVRPQEVLLAYNSIK